MAYNPVVIDQPARDLSHCLRNYLETKQRIAWGLDYPYLRIDRNNIIYYRDYYGL